LRGCDDRRRGFKLKGGGGRNWKVHIESKEHAAIINSNQKDTTSFSKRLITPSFIILPRQATPFVIHLSNTHLALTRNWPSHRAIYLVTFDANLICAQERNHEKLIAKDLTEDPPKL